MAVGPALEQAGTALLLGAPWAEAWESAPGMLTPLADALEPAWADGVAPGPLLRRAAESVRAGRHRQAQEAAARLGVRLVLPLGLCFLPAFILLGVFPVVIAAGGPLLGR
ncbi:type II secretion system F family protein [Georgenia sp. SYP-B2076]|uniref:type II secretion system F family protein n=1 Tax=Georgenia sp. SYP-B2076 TaxID=2495881 RepID=UPI00197AEB62|nr:type II secretion system F family protein [Georgenia sp. SYP-B2076]